jgi:aldehyde:ferredoxin oxidoreductase
VIGPAGENRVRFAGIASQHRFAGRCGTGAVMGAKNLKAVIADGHKTVPVASPGEYAKLRKEITKFLLAHPMTGGPLKELGTANLVMTTAGRNILPVRNFQAGQDAEAWRLSGHKMRDELLVRNDGCLACPIRCGRHVRVRGREGKGPEYETIGLLGSNLGIFDLEDVVELGQRCDELGMDTISMGGVLGFVTELAARGMMDSDLAFGDVEAYRRAVTATALRQGLGDELADGVARLADRHGGHAFAMHVKGLELPAYDPRGVVGQGLEYAVTSRGGCHIRGSTMFLEATGPVSVDPLSPRAKPELVVFQQNTNASVSSLHMCIFSAYAVIPDFLFRMDPNGLPYRAAMSVLKYAGGPIVGLMLRMKNPSQMLWFEKFLSLVIGRTVGMGELDEIGARICNLERIYNLREGKTGDDDTLPRRALDEPLSPQMGRGVPLDEMLPRYYRVRGWDRSGVPTPETLDRLRIRR